MKGLEKPFSEQLDSKKETSKLESKKETSNLSSRKESYNLDSRKESFRPKTEKIAPKEEEKLQYVAFPWIFGGIILFAVLFSFFLNYGNHFLNSWWGLFLIVPVLIFIGVYKNKKKKY